MVPCKVNAKWIKDVWNYLLFDFQLTKIHIKLEGNEEISFL